MTSIERTAHPRFKRLITTHGRSFPVFALAHLLGFDLMPGIRNWKELPLYRPSKQTEYVHIDALLGEPGKNVIDFDPIEPQFRHLRRVAVSVRKGAFSSSTLLTNAVIFHNHRRPGQVIRIALPWERGH
ncbi:Tn3 family transposase [Streptomyces sp. NPDC087769]|uniref:Tn3 family transposase n=1 Tax=Streptomyces sp. NPDC087769 TaxID=3365802 RepID=UPI003830E2DA